MKHIHETVIYLTITEAQRDLIIRGAKEVLKYSGSRLHVVEEFLAGRYVPNKGTKSRAIYDQYDRESKVLKQTITEAQELIGKLS